MRLIHFYLWLPMILLAFANAMMRETILKNYVVELRAHQISTISLMVFCTLYIFFIFPLLKISSVSSAIWLGIYWTLLTFLFETLLGKITGRTWSQIFENYNMNNGHIWPLFLFFLLILPSLVLLVKN